MHDLLSHFVRALLIEVGVRIRVIGDLVPVGRDAPRQLRPLLRIFADQKERRRHLQLVQNVEQHRREDGVRPIVERQRDQTRPLRAIPARNLVRRAIKPRHRTSGELEVDVGRRRDDCREPIARVNERAPAAVYQSGRQHDRGNRLHPW